MTSDIRHRWDSKGDGSLKSWRDAGLRSVGQQSVVNRIHEQILGLLASGWLKPGDRIPPETELGELFGAGRSSVREALNMLAGANLIRRDRHGTYVTDRVEQAIRTGLQTGILLGGGTVHDLFEARKVYEVGMVEAVADRADAVALAEIEPWVIDPETPTAVSAFRRVDMSFHTAIAAATRNPVIIQLYGAIRDILFQSHVYYARLGAEDRTEARSLISVSLRDHRQVYDAILARDPPAARQAMVEHFRHLEERLSRGPREAYRGRGGGGHTSDKP